MQLRFIGKDEKSGNTGSPTVPLPGNDFWLFDETALIVNHFDGQGDWASPGMELDDDPSAFELVWERAVPHADFTV